MKLVISRSVCDSMAASASPLMPYAVARDGEAPVVACAGSAEATDGCAARG